MLKSALGASHSYNLRSQISKIDSKTTNFQMTHRILKIIQGLKKINQIKNWSHQVLILGPSTRRVDVIPLHHRTICCSFSLFYIYIYILQYLFLVLWHFFHFLRAESLKKSHQSRFSYHGEAWKCRVVHRHPDMKTQWVSVRSIAEFRELVEKIHFFFFPVLGQIISLIDGSDFFRHEFRAFLTEQLIDGLDDRTRARDEEELITTRARIAKAQEGSEKRTGKRRGSSAAARNERVRTSQRRNSSWDHKHACLGFLATSTSRRSTSSNSSGNSSSNNDSSSSSSNSNTS